MNVATTSNADWLPAEHRFEAPGAILRLWLSSWFVSFVVHFALILLMATWLHTQDHRPVGFADEGMREIGLVTVPGTGTAINEITGDRDGPDEGHPDATAQMTVTQQPDSLAPENVTPPAPPIEPALPTESPTTVIGVGASAPNAEPQPRELIKPSGTRPDGGAGGQAPGSAAGGTSFMGLKDRGQRIVFLIDRSGSMAEHNAMRAAKAALVSSIQALDAQQRFQIVFYNETPRIMTLRGESIPDLYPATEINKSLTRQYVRSIHPEQGTLHLVALRKALEFRPEVVYFLTDAESQLTAGELDQVEQANRRKARIHCIEFGRLQEVNTDNFLKKLARRTGGTYRYVDVTKFGKTTADFPEEELPQ